MLSVFGLLRKYFNVTAIKGLSQKYFRLIVHLNYSEDKSINTVLFCILNWDKFTIRKEYASLFILRQVYQGHLNSRIYQFCWISLINFVLCEKNLCNASTQLEVMLTVS